MTRTMRVRPDHCPYERAQIALGECVEAGRQPQAWKMGVTVRNRLFAEADRNHSGEIGETLYGLRWSLDRLAPHDLLELDEF